MKVEVETVLLSQAGSQQQRLLAFIDKNHDLCVMSPRDLSPSTAAITLGKGITHTCIIEGSYCVDSYLRGFMYTDLCVIRSLYGGLSLIDRLSGQRPLIFCSCIIRHSVIRCKQTTLSIAVRFVYAFATLLCLYVIKEHQSIYLHDFSKNLK